MIEQHTDAHERRFKGGADMLRAPERTALLEIPRVLSLTFEGIQAGTLLDVGTGTGLFAEAFLSMGLRVTGIDPNPELLAKARLHVKGADFIRGVAEKLPFADGSFDVVFMGLVLHETDDPAAALAEARRIARKRVVVLEWPYREEEHGPPLAHRLSPKRIMALVRSSGYGGVEKIGLGHADFYRLTP